ncbi:hypothetical protein AL471_016100 [Vibrio alginolyticus]|nr:hypothetical protein AL471_016100 [Vibrio alginolyticus]
MSAKAIKKFAILLSRDAFKKIMQPSHKVLLHLQKRMMLLNKSGAAYTLKLNSFMELFHINMRKHRFLKVTQTIQRLN